MNIRHCLCLLVMMPCLAMHAWHHRIYDPEIRTLQVVTGDNPLLPPVVQLGRFNQLSIEWDNMTHEYQRFVYRVEHCTWDWQKSEELFESEYLSGNNNQPVETYETSFNTTQNYTHYNLRLPNADTGILLSGNYRVLVFRDGEEDEGPVLEARFSVWENAARLGMQVSSNTDIDYNDRHQQVSLQLGYGTLDVLDPATQLHAVVVQNRRGSRTVVCPPPDIRNSRGVEWTHCRDLIFPAGNEYHKFEILDVHHSGMNVDYMRWYEPYYHATLWEDKPGQNYLTDEDHNGCFLPRTEDQMHNETESEYVVVHFTLRMPRLGKDVYVSGNWSNGETDPSCRMEYDELNECYEAGIVLKQGYYNYHYITGDGETARTMGDFWQTENEYQTFIYYRDQGGRYDRLVAYGKLDSRQ